MQGFRRASVVQAEAEQRGRDLASQQLNNLAIAHEATGKYAAAVALFRRAIALNPSDWHARLNLAVILVNEDRVDEALELVDGVAEAHPDYKVHLVRAFAHLARGEIEAAIPEALLSDELDHGNVTGRFFGGSTILLSGDWQRGWERYNETVLSAQSFGPMPRWDGKRVEKLLVVADQGQGDVINFARYLPWVAKLVDKVTFSIPPLMLRLLHPYQRHATIVVGHASVTASAQIQLTGLARVYGTRPGTMPADPGLLYADPFAFPPKDKGRLRVGICWAGNPKYPRDRWRSMPFEAMLPLAANPNIDLFSLQVGPRAADIVAAGAQSLVVDLSGRIEHEWSVTAGAIKALDAIVTIDTAIAHIAGALGKPTFLCLNRTPDWRWLAGGAMTGWYPSVRIVRQGRFGDWPGVIAKVAEQLAELT